MPARYKLRSDKQHPLNSLRHHSLTFDPLQSTTYWSKFFEHVSPGFPCRAHFTQLILLIDELSMHFESDYSRSTPINYKGKTDFVLILATQTWYHIFTKYSSIRKFKSDQGYYDYSILCRDMETVDLGAEAQMVQNMHPQSWVHLHTLKWLSIQPNINWVQVNSMELGNDSSAQRFTWVQ